MWKKSIVSFSLAILIAFAFLVLAAPPAHAWTHEANNWDANHNDFYCGTSSSSPCLYWAQPSNTSITLHAFFDLSLQNAPGSYNFDVAVTRALNDWNSQVAWNPYIVECEGRTDSITYAMTTLPYGVWGQTDLGNYGTVQYNSTNGFWYAPLNYVFVYFSSAVTWNNSLQFSATMADGRTVSTHETGHALGLGHTGHTPAIMRQGTVTYYSVQTDDLNGLQSIYPGYYPGSEQ